MKRAPLGQAGVARCRAGYGILGADLPLERAIATRRPRPVDGAQIYAGGLGRWSVVAVPQRLKGRYEIKEILGQGGMGVVYRAWDNAVKRDVALKTLRDAPTRAAIDMFFKECEVLARFSHPNIIEIFDVGEYEEDETSKPFFVMPLLPGSTLDRLIAGASHRLTVERAIDILCQTCRGLHTAHDHGLVHRDMKPSNIFVMDDDSVKIIDFGVAHLVEHGQSIGVKGTLLYMAPEQLQMQPATAASDIFSVGVVAYEALTRRRPFQGAKESDVAEAVLRLIPPPVSELNPAVNQALGRTIHKAMAKQPWSRYANAREFADTLQKALRNEPIEFFNPARIQPRIDRATQAFEKGDLQFANEILTELEAEGHADSAITSLKRQLELARRTRQIAQLLESARTRFEQEEYPLALHKIQDILQLDPGNASALGMKASIEKKLTSQKVEDWHRLARQHLDNQAFSHAREAVRNMLQLRPGDTAATQLMAEIDRREQEYTRIRKQKQKLYDQALEAWNAGEISSALTKLERVLELDHEAPDTVAPDRADSYQQFYQKVRSEHELLNSSYAESRKLLAERNFTQARAIAQTWLARYPGHALFQALKFDIDERERQDLSARIAAVDAQMESEPDLDRKVSILEQALAAFPGEAHFERQLRPLRDKRDLVNSLAAKARYHEERGQFAEALGQWEILKTIYSEYPGLNFEVERVAKRRDQQALEEAKARWIEQIDAAMAAADYARAGELAAAAEAEFPADVELQHWKEQARTCGERAAEAEQLLADGKALCAEQRYEDGVRVLRNANALDPRSVHVRGVLVEVLLERARALLDTDWRAAEPLIQEALEIEPNHAVAKSFRTTAADRKRDEAVTRSFTLARQLRAAGDYENAVRAVEECYAQYPLDPRLAQMRDILKREWADARRSKERPADLEALRALEQRIAGTTEVAAACEILNQALAIAARCGDDAEIRRIVAVIEVQHRELAAAANPAAGDALATVLAAVPPALGEAATVLAATPMPAAQPAPPAPAPQPPPAAAPQPAPRTAAPQKAPPAASAPKPPRKRAWILGGAIGLVAALIPIGFFALRSSGPLAPALIPMEISTTPPGATIRVAGEVRGTSPLTLEQAPGSYRIEAALAGYQPATLQVNVAAGAAPVSFTLQPMPHTVRLVTNLAEGQAVLDDQPPRDLQEGQVTFDSVAAGDHTLRLVSKQGEATIAFRAAPGHAPELTAAPVVKDVAALVVANIGTRARVHTTVPAARIDLDGQTAGTLTADSLDLPSVPPGLHDIVADDGKILIRKSVEIAEAPALNVLLESDRNVGTLIVSTGEDGVDVFVNGQRHNRKTSRGRLPVQREPGQYRVRVAKQGFQDVAEQVVTLSKGEDKQVVFKLVALPTTAQLAIRGASPGAQVFLDGAAIGTTQADGTFHAGSIAPGEHSVELRAGKQKSRLVRRSFAAGDTLALTGGEVELAATTGTLVLSPNPAAAQVAVVREGGPATAWAGKALELDEGAYTLTAKAAGHRDYSQKFQLAGGQSLSISFSLVRETAPAGGMEGWDAPWQSQGQWYTRKGVPVALYRASSAAATYSFTLMQPAGTRGILRRSRTLDWVVNWQDARNFLQYSVDKDLFRRYRVVNGQRREEVKKPHALKFGEQLEAAVRAEVSNDAVVTRLRVGEQWVVLDTLQRAGSQFTRGRFGILIHGDEEIRMSGFSFQPNE